MLHIWYGIKIYTVILVFVSLRINEIMHEFDLRIFLKSILILRITCEVFYCHSTFSGH